MPVPAGAGLLVVLPAGYVKIGEGRETGGMLVLRVGKEGMSVGGMLVLRVGKEGMSVGTLDVGGVDGTGVEVGGLGAGGEGGELAGTEMPLRAAQALMSSSPKQQALEPRQ